MIYSIIYIKLQEAESLAKQKLNVEYFLMVWVIQIFKFFLIKIYNYSLTIQSQFPFSLRQRFCSLFPDIFLFLWFCWRKNKGFHSRGVSFVIPTKNVWLLGNEFRHGDVMLKRKSQRWQKIEKKMQRISICSFRFF